jgi:hypothetical protein
MLHALRLLGLPNKEREREAVAAADPRVVPLLRAWSVVEGQAFREFMKQFDEDEDDDDPPDDPEAESPPASAWAAVGFELTKVAAERSARLRDLLAGYEQNEAEIRAKLAYEAAFDDSAEGERLHRYQARWGRSLMRTLAMIQDLRGQQEDGLSQGCALIDTDTEKSEPAASATEGQGHDLDEGTSDCESCVADLTSDCDSSNCDEPCSSADHGLTDGEPEMVSDSDSESDPGSAPRREEKRQNKATAEEPIATGMGPGVEGPEGEQATRVHLPDHEFDDPDSVMRQNRGWWC